VGINNGSDIILELKRDGETLNSQHSELVKR